MARKRGTQFESVMPLLLKGRYKTQVHDIIKFENGETFQQYFLCVFLKQTIIKIVRTISSHLYNERETRYSLYVYVKYDCHVQKSCT